MAELTALLSRPAYEGYPTEYLLARLRGRRAQLGSEPHHAAAWTEAEPSRRYRSAAGRMTAAEARQARQAEFRWVYRQMNEGLRNTYAPLFLWFEMRTILLCLRFRRGGERLQAAGLLADSLLTDELQRVLTEEGEAAAVMDDLAGLLAAIAEPYRSLGSFCRERGGRECEQRLVTLYLERMTELPLQPVVREFFRSVIDMRNLVTLAKQMRWQLNEPAAFIRGGTISAQRLVKAREEGTAAGLAALLGVLPDMGALPAVPGNPEQLLLRWLTGRVHRLGRDPLGSGLILDYLWKCFVEARNLSIILHCGEMDRETVRAELI